jgi:hypothetical protein
MFKCEKNHRAMAKPRGKKKSTNNSSFEEDGLPGQARRNPGSVRLTIEPKTRVE